MAMRVLVTLTLLAALAAPDAATLDPARQFLTTAFDLSAADVRRLDRGDVVASTLETKNHREVATLGIVRIGTSASRYAERLADIVSFKRADGVLQIGRFSRAPELADVASLTIEESDIRRLRGCRIDDCDLRLPQDAIERVRRDVDWDTPDAPRQASALVRQLLVDYVAAYCRRGTAAAMEYANRPPRLNVGREFASLIDADPITSAYAPRLRRHLLDYPAPSGEAMADFVYWSKERIRGRPVISITHVATARAVDGSPVAYAIGSKQIYAMHYYDASLGLTLLIPDQAAASPATYVVYLNRSRIDLFDGFFGGVARRIVAGKARGVVVDQLQRLQRVLGGEAAEAAARAR